MVKRCCRILILAGLFASCEGSEFKGASDKEKSTGANPKSDFDYYAEYGYPENYSENVSKEGADVKTSAGDSEKKSGEEASSEETKATENMENEEKIPVSLAEATASLKTECEQANSNNLLKNASTTVSFASNDGEGKQCDWRVEKQDRRAAGIKMWTEGFSIPEFRKICGMRLSSSNGFKYDDYLVFSLNKRVLFWGNFNISNLEVSEGFPVFDFDKVFDQSSNRLSTCAEGFDECIIPSKGESKAINVSFNGDTTYAVAAEANQNGANFTMRVLGNNDEGKDCEHVGLDLIVEYKYIDK